ncbi:CRISPR-associated endoribonuclease Cas6 [Spirulina sp. CS-785/01]|uniref:CRISPR-associated endoribonuclease Cas6 n=1 Tax=Spirulina sp. CS-785/01 TaxID=3021716 RepID=UPI00232F4334|nr:CRISPR-associated endoribonuclease Cas6 [Spirulina sp. CS-785/01]MDB9316013.1 CRISPR-associated endoribonuclease Cas6 [Spirulina sp. CS-785/01]
MPYSLVFNLIPLAPISPKYLQGRHIHALFLSLVNAVDAELSEQLHQSQGNKPFTTSPLQTYNQNNAPLLQWHHPKPIPKGTPCWVRVSLLDEGMFSRLTQLWLNLNLERPWHLGPTDLQITSILGTPQAEQPWANACLYEQLYEEASSEERNLSFLFATPMAFRQGKYDTAFPQQESVFNSLRSRWNKYSGIELPELALENLYPSFFNIHTEMVMDARSKFIGCVGELTYRFLGKTDGETVKQVNALADFAVYAGVGRKTTMGMGMVRRRKP